MFVSSTPFTPSTGIATADTQCQNDAKAAGFATYANFLALLSTSTTPAISRVSTVGPPFKRPDEVLVVLDPADLPRNNVMAAIDVSAAGLYSNRVVWTGSSDVTKTSDGYSCNDWTSAVGGSAGFQSYFGYGFAQTPDWFNSGRQGCDVVNSYVICAEK